MIIILPISSKVKCVDIIKMFKGKDARKSDHQVKDKRQHVASKDAEIEISFVSNWRQKRWQRVMTHERVDANAKQLWHLYHICKLWFAVGLFLDKHLHCDSDHTQKG